MFLCCNHGHARGSGAINVPLCVLDDTTLSYDDDWRAGSMCLNLAQHLQKAEVSPFRLDLVRFAFILQPFIICFNSFILQIYHFGRHLVLA